MHVVFGHLTSVRKQKKEWLRCQFFFRGSPSPKSDLSLIGPICYGFCPDLSRCEPVDKDFETWAFVEHYRQNYDFKILIIEWHISPAGNTWCFLSKSLLGCCFVNWRQTGAIWEGLALHGETAFIRLALRQVYGAHFLINNWCGSIPLWVVPTLGRRSWAVYESRLRNPWGTSK